MDANIATFLAFTATEDPAVAKQFLDISGDNLEYAVQLFMESGSHSAPPNTSANDEEYAQRLQSEAYEDGGVREADSNVHRHETLLDSYPSYNTGIPDANAIFGTGRVGIFNQRYNENGGSMHDFDDDDNYELADRNDRIVELDSDEDDDDIIEIDSDEEPISRPNRRTQVQRDRLNELSSTQRRLAELFKPPFELIVRTSIEGARKQGREEKKWILVNIQDQSEFQCQVLNRDFWSNPSIREIVRGDFIFLQYQHDSPHGESYSNFYSIDAYPHISILDPMTGERVHKWADGIVPNVEEWVADVELFLEKFSLQPGSSNPTAKHDVRIDPDAMSEEQQIEYAMRQSMGNASGSNFVQPPTSSGEPEVLPSAPETKDPFQSISPQEHNEPTAGPSTRVQIRFPNGKRLIHKFDPESDRIVTVYAWLKHVLATAEEGAYGIGDEEFTISCPGKPKLIECLDQTVKDAGLMNASILLEKS